MIEFSICLRGMLLCLISPVDCGNVSLAWSVWSRAAESALVDAFQV